MRLLDGPDATPPADLSLHIGQFDQTQISGPFHEPCDLAHQVDDRLIVLLPMGPMTQTQQTGCKISEAHGCIIAHVTLLHSLPISHFASPPNSRRTTLSISCRNVESSISIPRLL